MATVLDAALPALAGPALAAVATLEVLSDDVSPDELCARIGAAADGSWAKGDPIEGECPDSPLARRGFHGVVYGSRAAHGDDPHVHVHELLTRLAPHARAIGALVDGGGAISRLTVFCRSEGHGQSHALLPEQLAVLAELRALVWINAWVVNPL